MTLRRFLILTLIVKLSNLTMNTAIYSTHLPWSQLLLDNESPQLPCFMSTLALRYIPTILSPLRQMFFNFKIPKTYKAAMRFPRGLPMAIGLQFGISSTPQYPHVGTRTSLQPPICH